MSIQKTFLPAKNKYKVVFKLQKNKVNAAREVRLLGTFNNWDKDKSPIMKAYKNHFSTSVELSSGQTYEFRYLVDESYWINDDGADGYVLTPFADAYNCLIKLPDIPNQSSMNKKSTASDDFTKIEGIGPKINALLHAADLHTYEQLSNSSKAKISEILISAGSRYKIHDPTTWANQAALLADNRIEELKKLQSELKGGRAV